MSERLFDVKEETWWDFSKAPTVSVQKLTVRPHRRRSWTKEALTAALDYVKATAPHDFIVSGSNTTDMLKLLHRRLPKGAWR